MIQWSLTLTGNQIAVMRALRGRVKGKLSDEYHELSRDLSHWPVGVRTLLRTLLKEGLIEHCRVFQAGHGEKDLVPLVDPARSGQFLTERGRFVLQMIEQDIVQFLTPKRKKAKAA